MEKPLFLLITRTQTPEIEKKIRSLVHAGIDAYAVVDDEPVSGKRFLTMTNESMKQLGWTHHMSRKIHTITAWDKATYLAYKSGREHVWISEDDVYWNTVSIPKYFKNMNSKADLIAFPLAPSYDEVPDWYHWDKVAMLTPQKKYWTATFNQFCRLSKRLLGKMHEVSVKRKRLFFHEGMFATLCNMNGYIIQYLDELRLENLYIHFRWDKPYTEEEVKHLIKEHDHILIHPVKFQL
jgi:hypothetical protein